MRINFNSGGFVDRKLGRIPSPWRNEKAAEFPRRLLGDGMFDQHAFVALMALTTVRRASSGRIDSPIDNAQRPERRTARPQQCGSMFPS